MMSVIASRVDASRVEEEVSCEYQKVDIRRHAPSSDEIRR
jgi:hypothetical protein